MEAIRVMDLRNNLKNYCEKAFSGEPLLVYRPGKKNIVVISETEYNSLREVRKQDAILKFKTKILDAEASRLAGDPTYTLDEVFGD